MDESRQPKIASHRSPRHLRCGHLLALLTLAVVLATTIPESSRAATPVCGNGVVDADEDCDLGGTCIGGSAAGTACHVGDTTCTGGTCTTFGGKGCAANCTTEHDVPYPLVPGQLDGLDVVPGTSGVAIASDFLSIPLPFGAALHRRETMRACRAPPTPIAPAARACNRSKS